MHVKDQIADMTRETSMQLHFHSSRAQRIEEDVYNVRAAELMSHKRWVTRHVAGVRDRLQAEKYDNF